MPESRSPRQINDGAHPHTRHGGNCGATPFYLGVHQDEPEYDQGDAVIVWYDDLYDLAKRAEAAEAEVARLTHELDELRQPICMTCHGRGWVARTEFHDHGNGQASGGVWNEPCPDCWRLAGSSPLPGSEKP